MSECLSKSNEYPSGSRRVTLSLCDGVSIVARGRATATHARPRLVTATAGPAVEAGHPSCNRNAGLVTATAGPGHVGLRAAR